MYFCGLVVFKTAAKVAFVAVRQQIVDLISLQDSDLVDYSMTIDSNVVRRLAIGSHLQYSENLALNYLKKKPICLNRQVNPMNQVELTIKAFIEEG